MRPMDSRNPHPRRPVGRRQLRLVWKMRTEESTKGLGFEKCLQRASMRRRKPRNSFGNLSPRDEGIGGLTSDIL
jgi:hypothetical protein